MEKTFIFKGRISLQYSSGGSGKGRIGRIVNDSGPIYPPLPWTFFSLSSLFSHIISPFSVVDLLLLLLHSQIALGPTVRRLGWKQGSLFWISDSVCQFDAELLCVDGPTDFKMIPGNLF